MPACDVPECQFLAAFQVTSRSTVGNTRTSILCNTHTTVLLGVGEESLLRRGGDFRVWSLANNFRSDQREQTRVKMLKYRGVP